MAASSSFFRFLITGLLPEKILRVTRRPTLDLAGAAVSGSWQETRTAGYQIPALLINPLRLRQQIRVAHQHPFPTGLLAEDGQRAAGPHVRIAAGPRDDAHGQHGPAISEIAGNLDLLDVARRLHAMRAEQAPQTLLERLASSHRGLAGDEEHHVLRHEAKDGLYVPGSRGAVPLRDEVSNGLFVGAHGGSSSP